MLKHELHTRKPSRCVAVKVVKVVRVKNRTCNLLIVNGVKPSQGKSNQLGRGVKAAGQAAKFAGRKSAELMLSHFVSDHLSSSQIKNIIFFATPGRRGLLPPGAIAAKAAKYAGSKNEQRWQEVHSARMTIGLKWRSKWCNVRSNNQKESLIPSGTSKRVANTHRSIAFIAVAAVFLCSQAVHSQVINFDVAGGAGAANYSGQAGLSDPGNNYWNPIVGGGTTGATNLLSDGVTPSPITLTSQLGGTYGTQGANGTAAGLQQPYEYNNAILRTNTLNNVPPGTYSLYLYGINNTGTRGTTFTVSTAIMPPVMLNTVNTPASLTNFTQGADYVVFSNVVVGAAKTITFTWVANPNVTLSGNNEGDLNAVQLAFVSANTVVTNPVPNFGANVLIFDPSMSMASIQIQLSSVYSQQQESQFGSGRFAYFFKPGQYSNLDVNLGYYTQVIGLGQMPGDTLITGNIHSEGALANDNATCNFWRCCENLSLIPTNNSTMTWAVSQGTSLRRMHIEGSLNLSDTESGAYSSGGFLADSKVDATVSSITQQQWFSRNDVWGNWSGQNWNMVFVGVSNPPSGTWPGKPFTIINKTPLIAEKPYLYLDTNGNYNVFAPSLSTNGTSGITWASAPTPGVSLPISQFYLAQPGVDNSASINSALNSGKSLILTPGMYNLTNSILVTRPDTIVTGLGYPTLIPTGGFPAMIVSDVNGVKVSGIIFDAGSTAPSSLLEVGTATTSLDHSADPIFLYDICSRVGGQTVGTTTNCVTINANNIVGDNLWLWRADHGAGSSPAWTGNPSNSGLVVNGNNVTMYGLFVEHHEQYQTLWNGNGGRVYFYQSEMPYDAPSQSAWSHNGINGYASYKVANTVTSHEAYGLGVYGVFTSSTAKCFNAIETPTNSQQVNLHDMINVYITGETGSEMTHIINGTGTTLTTGVTTTTANTLWTNPTFGIKAGLSGTNVAISFPTESWHSYKLFYKNAVTGGTWSALGSALPGNDAIETLTDSPATTARFYRVQSQ